MLTDPISPKPLFCSFVQISLSGVERRPQQLPGCHRGHDIRREGLRGPQVPRHVARNAHRLAHLRKRPAV